LGTQVDDSDNRPSEQLDTVQEIGPFEQFKQDPAAHDTGNTETAAQESYIPFNDSLILDNCKIYMDLFKESLLGRFGRHYPMTSL